MKTKIKGLGEVILRVHDMELMKNFYHQTLALFAKANLNAFGEGFSDLKKDHSTLHHFALEIDKQDYTNVLNFCNASNIEYVTEVFVWINWRSIFIKDPESNVVEFVCHDSEIIKNL